MTTPGVAPGSVPPPMDDTARRLRWLEQRVDELSRKDLSNAQVGQGGRLRGLYSNGEEAFAFGLDPSDGSNRVKLNYSNGQPVVQVRPGNNVDGEVMEVLDRAQNPVIQTDVYAGYGLQHPFFSYTMPGYEEIGLGGATTQGTAVELSKNIGFAYNYARHVISRIRIRNGTPATTVGVFLELQDFNNNVIGTSTVQTFSIGATVIGISTFERMVSLTEDYMSTRVQTLIKAFSPGGATVNIQAMPQMCSGIAKNWFDFYPQFH